MGEDAPVSVVMPVRDGAEFLAPAIESILGQNLEAFEFLIIDDGSRDATPEILQGFAGRDARIRLLATGGAGIVAALNLGLAAARGRYIARMDADDIALPERLSLQFERLETSLDLAALGAAAIAIDATGRELETLRMPVSAAEVREALRDTNPLLHPTVMMRRTAVLAAGGYRRACTYAEDYDLWLRLAAAGDLANLPEPLLKLRRHAAQTSTVRRLDQRAAFALARRVNDRSAPTAPIDFDVNLKAALGGYLPGRLARPEAISVVEAKDLAIMLRACARSGALTPGEIRSMGGRIAAAQGDWMLPIKLLLRR